ncbi:MAG: fumarylacetoacetase [Bacteroidetes bacterium]|nr:fumarylacetoacetase [Bacteroidota bacterium]
MIDINSKSWLSIPVDSDFPIQNIPFGIIRTKGNAPRPATIIGDTVIDLSAMADFGFFDNLGIEDLTPFYKPFLNDFIALGKKHTNAVRERVAEVFSAGNDELKEYPEAREMILIPVNDAEMLMPVQVGDYTDFYSSREHATNVGMMFRDPDNALLPNWLHIPVGYHGRSSSIVVSGTHVHRPNGQTKPDNAPLPVFGPSRQLDFELEMAFITGKSTELGNNVPVDRAEDYIFGMVLFNDLSARDIQKWEYVPLGPFLSKSFASVISPWIVTLEALEYFRTKGPVQEPQVLPYLQSDGEKTFDINLEVLIQPEGSVPNSFCRSNFKYLYWNMSQQLAHQTVNGCNINVGDMYASGTISGADPGSYGSLLELTWKGTKPVHLPDGSVRTFLLDGDSVIMKGFCEKDGLRIGFGESACTLLPAKKIV